MSSVLTGDVAVGAQSAVDGDPATAWLAEPVDDRPTLDLVWGQPRTIDRLRLVAPTAPVAASPRSVLVRTPAGEVPATVAADGWVTFPAVTTDRLAVVVTGSDAAVADPRGVGWPAPVGVAEVEVPALADLLTRGSASALAAPCGSGPTVSLDGVSYPTSVSGTVADVRAGRSLPVTVCDDFAIESVQLPAGEHRLRTEPSASFVIDTAVLTPDGMSAAPVDTRPVTVQRWDVTDRSVTVGPGAAALLVVPENFNTGWTATPRRGAAAGGAGRRVAAGVRGAGGRGWRGDAARSRRTGRTATGWSRVRRRCCSSGWWRWRRWGGVAGGRLSRRRSRAAGGSSYR